MHENRLFTSLPTAKSADKIKTETEESDNVLPKLSTELSTGL